MTSRRGWAGRSRPATTRPWTPRPACSTCCWATPGRAVVGDEIAGATIEQARLGVVELGRLHGPLLGDISLAQAPWLNRDASLNQAMIAPLYAGFVERYGD